MPETFVTVTPVPDGTTLLLESEAFAYSAVLFATSRRGQSWAGTFERFLPFTGC